MKRMRIYLDASVIGGCEDEEFAEDTLALWRHFSEGSIMQVLSEHTLRELAGAPAQVRAHLEKVPKENQIIGLIEIRTPKEVVDDEKRI